MKVDRGDVVIIDYPFSTGGAVEMVGEGNFWRFAKYNDSNIVYKYLPK